MQNFSSFEVISPENWDWILVLAVLYLSIRSTAVQNTRIEDHHVGGLSTRLKNAVQGYTGMLENRDQTGSVNLPTHMVGFADRSIRVRGINKSEV